MSGNVLPVPHRMLMCARYEVTAGCLDQDERVDLS